MATLIQSLSNTRSGQSGIETRIMKATGCRAYLNPTALMRSAVSDAVRANPDLMRNRNLVRAIMTTGVGLSGCGLYILMPVTPGLSSATTAAFVLFTAIGATGAIIVPVIYRRHLYKPLGHLVDFERYVRSHQVPERISRKAWQCEVIGGGTVVVRSLRNVHILSLLHGKTRHDVDYWKD